MDDDESSASIEIRVERITQLFDTLDPFPVPQRDLANNIEDYVVGWARELAAQQSIKIVVHLPSAEATDQTTKQLGDAFSAFFRERAERSRLNLKELFRVGRWSLLIGLTVLAVCLALGQFIGRLFGRDSSVSFRTRALSSLLGSPTGGRLRYFCMIGYLSSADETYTDGYRRPLSSSKLFDF